MFNILTVFISTEILSICICLILACADLFGVKFKTKTRRPYAAMLYTLIAALVLDCISWIYEENADAELIEIISTLLASELSLVLLAEFAFYIKTYISEKSDISSKFANAVIAVNCIFILATLIFYFTGELFTVSEGHYTDGPLYLVYFIFNIISMALNMLLIAIHRKNLGMHDTFAAFIYMLVPLFATLIGILTIDASFAYQASALSILILYIFVQSQRNQMLEAENREIEFYASHDVLTGLLNRRAYTERCEQLVTSKENLGILFCDINGLKYCNDHFGHNAGDKLIKDFSNLLHSDFPGSEIYRISGDEFVVFTLNIPRTEFHYKVEIFSKTMADNDIEIASIGSEYGNSHMISELIQMAERKMYIDKEDFYIKHPEYKR